jgi:hypothetical protein
MAPPVDVFTTRRTPTAAAAANTLIDPRTLTDASSCGSDIDARTSVRAARWKTRSGRYAANASRSGPPSRMSCLSSSILPVMEWRLAADPVLRSSTTSTDVPRPANASTTDDPTNPAPPVTTARSTAMPHPHAPAPTEARRSSPRGGRSVTSNAGDCGDQRIALCCMVQWDPGQEVKADGQPGIQPS